MAINIGLLQIRVEWKRSFLDVFYCMYPRRPPTSPQANPCVPHTCGAWKGIPEHPWVGGGRIETNKDGLVGVFRLGTGVAAMAGGGTCEIRNLTGTLRTGLQGLPSWVFLLSCTRHAWESCTAQKKPTGKALLARTLFPNRVTLKNSAVVSVAAATATTTD